MYMHMYALGQIIARDRKAMEGNGSTRFSVHSQPAVSCVALHSAFAALPSITSITCISEIPQQPTQPPGNSWQDPLGWLYTFFHATPAASATSWHRHGSDCEILCRAPQVADRGSPSGGICRGNRRQGHYQSAPRRDRRFQPESWEPRSRPVAASACCLLLASAFLR